MRFLTFAAAAPSANQPDIRLATFSLRGNEKHAAPHVPGMLSLAQHSYAPCSKTSRRGCVTPGSMLLVEFFSTFWFKRVSAFLPTITRTLAFFAPTSDSAYDVGRGRLSVFFIGNCALPPSRL